MDQRAGERYSYDIDVYQPTMQGGTDVDLFLL